MDEKRRKKFLKIKKAVNERIEKKSQIYVPGKMSQPRYDDIFEEGVKALDRQESVKKS